MTKWKPGVVLYLKSQGISLDVMKGRVRAISQIKTKKGIRSEVREGPMFAYNYSADGSFSSFKRCIPKWTRAKWFWENKKEALPYFPHNILEDKHERIFLVGGEKDVLTMLTHGYAAMCLNSESATLTESLHRDIMQQCDDLIVLYDTDAAGMKYSFKLGSEFGLRRVLLPADIDGIEYGNDVTDLFRAKIQGFSALKCLQRCIENAETIERIEPRETVNTKMNRLERYTEKIRELKSGKIEFPPPIVSIAGKPDSGFIFPYTINMIHGKSGVHKSRFAEIMASLFLSGKDHPIPELFLGMEKREQPYHVLYVDTERSIRNQLPYTIQCIQERAGIPREVDPENFSYITLFEEEREERFPILNKYLHEVRNKMKGFLVVILDVITDCVADFNSLKATNELIDLINIMVNNEECTFICVIHENPTGGDKARGHLGTELMNKSSARISAAYFDEEQDDSVRILLRKNRGGKRGLLDIHCDYDIAAKSLVQTHDMGKITRPQIEEMLASYGEIKAEPVKVMKPNTSFDHEAPIKMDELYMPPEIKPVETVSLEDEPFGEPEDDLPF